MSLWTCCPPICRETPQPWVSPHSHGQLSFYSYLSLRLVSRVEQGLLSGLQIVQSRLGVKPDVTLGESSCLLRNCKRSSRERSNSACVVREKSSFRACCLPGASPNSNSTAMVASDLCSHGKSFSSFHWLSDTPTHGLTSGGSSLTTPEFNLNRIKPYF